MEKKTQSDSPTRFHQLRSEKVMTGFHIRETQKCAFLDEWLSIDAQTLTETENAIIELALNRFRLLGRGWNEEELKMHFISPILGVADTNIESVCKTFFERPLSGVVNNYELNVITDCMVASYNEAGLPVNPYFFLQEFKQSQRFGRTDPEGQMMVAMLLAQEQNNDKKPIYGCFVVENNWRFTVLNGLEYCVSPQFNATEKNDLHKIVFILRKLKELILNR